MQKYANNVTDIYGNAVPGALVTVNINGGALATIYSDNGVTTRANPISTDSKGLFEFYAADGRYDITVNVSGNLTTLKDIILDDPVAADAGTSAFSLTVLDDTTAGAWLTTLGVTPPSTFINTMLDDATSNLALTTLTATRAETGAVAVPILTKFKEGPSLFDFIQGNLHAGIIARTNTTDLKAYIQAAIDAVATGEVILVYPGDYRIESVLTIQGLVSLVAAGGGQKTQPTVAAPVLFNWYGGATPMIDFGAQATVKVGGGLRGIRLDGRAIATTCLRVKDLQRGRFEDLLLTGAITQALELTNTDGLDPTGFNQFNNLHIQLRGGTTNSAHGVYINGVGTGAAGVTLNSFDRLRIEHANGDGLRFELRGDGNTFHDFYAFRASTTETGYGIRFNSTNAAAVVSSNTFTGNTIATGGIFLAAPSAVATRLPVLGTTFDNVNVTELASDITDRFNPFASSGITTMLNGVTEKGFKLGMSRIMHHHQGASFDAMRFVAHTFPLLNTNDGSWFGIRTGAAGTIASAGQAGGAVALTTDAASGDSISIYSSADFTSGITYASDPFLCFDATPVGTITTMRTQFGLFGDSTLPDPTDGNYVQWDPAVNANFQLVSRKAGASTTITTTFAGASAKRQWLICANAAQNVTFFTKLPTETEWTYLGNNLTNAPTVPLTPGYRVRTNTTAARVAHVYHSEFGHSHE